VPVEAGLCTFVKFTSDNVFGAQLADIDSTAMNLNDYIKNQLPRINTIDTSHLTSACAMGETGSSGVYSIIKTAELQNQYTPLSIVYVDLSQFQKEMLDANKTKALSTSLMSRDPELSLRFEQTVQSYHKFLSDFIDGPTCANTMRNFYYKFRGFIWDKVPTRQPKEDFKWKKTVDALVKGGIGSSEHTALISKQVTYESIHSFLSKIAKDRVTFAKTDFDVCIVDLIDLSNACISLMNI